VRREAVWRALTNPVEYGAWFGVKVEGRFAPGARVRGAITHKGYEHFDVGDHHRADGTRAAVLVALGSGGDRARRRLSSEPTTLVVFELEEVAGGTVVESGFDRMNGEGWAWQMRQEALSG
jgi:hypothetical protein